MAALRITFVVEKERSGAIADLVLRRLLQALFECDVLYLRANPGTPMLYESGVVYQEEPPGAEDWQDIPTSLALGWGDCLPLDTPLALADSDEIVPLRRVREGDRVLGFDGEPVVVRKVAVTGVKPVLTFHLSNANLLDCTPNHRLFRSSGEEVRARDVRVGDRLPTLRGRGETVVERIDAGCDQLVGCVETSTGRLYLPGSDVRAGQCEDLACWRAAELVVRHGIQARPDFTCDARGDGSRLYHIVVRLPDGRIEDPSRNLGMR